MNIVLLAVGPRPVGPELAQWETILGDPAHRVDLVTWRVPAADTNRFCASTLVLDPALPVPTTVEPPADTMEAAAGEALDPVADSDAHEPAQFGDGAEPVRLPRPSLQDLDLARLRLALAWRFRRERRRVRRAINWRYRKYRSIARRRLHRIVAVQYSARGWRVAGQRADVQRLADAADVVVALDASSVFTAKKLAHTRPSMRAVDGITVLIELVKAADRNGSR